MKTKPATRLRSREDRRLSPYTGWTREHWLELSRLLLSAVPRYADPAGGMVHFPGKPSWFGRRSDAMEGFSRSMILAALYLAGGGDPVFAAGGRRFDVAEFFRRGLVAGTDPEHPNYWGDMRDPQVPGQKLRAMSVLECGSMAWSMYVAREFIFAPMSKAQQDQVMAWITLTNQRPTWENNWLYFQVFANTVAKKLGYPHDAERVERNLAALSGCYRGSGWYGDGPNLPRFDYYNPWAMQLYPLIWALIDGESRPELARTFGQRTGEFLETYKHFFAPNGAYPAMGRSLIYRFGAIGIFGLAERMKLSPLPPGLSRRICSQNIRHFLESGMLAPGNYLSFGHLGAYEPIAESYSGPGSPLWATKGLAGLLNPPDSPFWTDEERPLPVEERSYCVTIPPAGLIVTGDRKTGHVQLYSLYSQHFVDKKYANFAYSSHFGIEAAQRDFTYNFDNCFALTNTGEHFVLRKTFTHLRTEAGFGACSWLPFGTEKGSPDQPAQAETLLVVKDDFHVRLTRLKADRPCWALDGGYALGYSRGRPRIKSGRGWEYAAAGGRCSFIKALAGYDEQVPAEGLCGEREGNNLLHRFSVVPGLRKRIREAGEHVFGALVVARLAEEPPQRLAKLAAQVEPCPPGFVVRFHDGEAVFCQFEPLQEVSLQLNGAAISGKVRYARVSREGEVLGRCE